MSKLGQIVEVGPRDGLQNEKVPIPTEAKIAFIHRLFEAGLTEIEVSSFVSPKWVPQLGDIEAIWPHLPKGGLYSALVPNMKGFERALALDVRRISLFTATSETFVQKNLNMSIDQSLEQFKQIIAEHRATGPGFIRAYISMIVECPFEGKIEPVKVLSLCEKLMEMGVDEISLGETIGVAVPFEIRRLIGALYKKIPNNNIAWHFHDTRGTGMANVFAAMDAGYRRFDSSAAGLGGCPYAVGAGGNIATEDLVYMMQRFGRASEVDLSNLSKASLPILEVLGKPPTAKAQVATLSTCTT